MATKIIIYYFLTLYPFYCLSQNIDKTDTTKRIDTTYFLQSDTLFSNAGFYIFIGQKLYAGKGSQEDDCYQTISFKSFLAFPLWFMRQKEIENNYEYQSDPSRRDADKVKETLSDGKELIVTEIKRKKGPKGTHWYQIFLKDTEKILSYKYSCSIVDAIRLKEIKLTK